LAVNIQLRRGTAAGWAAANPILLAGEIGYETNTFLFKVGDGVTAYNSLSYALQGAQGIRGVPGQDGDDGDPAWDYFGRGTLPIQSMPDQLLTPVSLIANTANQASTTEAIISPQITIPPGFVRVGSVFEIEFAFSAAQGAVAQTTPGIVFRLRWGGLAGTILATTGIITPATLLAAAGGYCRAHAVVRSLGATGTIMADVTVSDPRGDRPTLSIGNETRKSTVPAAAVTVNTTTSNILCVTAQCTVADAANITFGVTGYARLIMW
jgi:hypothetical protein